MISTYVLIIILIGTGRAVADVPFENRDECNKAAEAITNLNNFGSNGIFARCFLRK